MKNSLLALLLLIPSLVFAEANTELSGFIYAMKFSNQDWYQDHSVLAVNIDHTNDYLNIRSQLSTHDIGDNGKQMTMEENSPIRRLVVEKDFKSSESTETIVRVGRFARINSFYDSITDSPANFNMAMLPQAGYNFRMYNGAFVIMDGIQGVFKYEENDTLTTLYASRGKMFINNQEELIREIFKQKVADIKMTPDMINDVALHFEFKNYHAYASYSEYEATTNIVNKTATSAFMSAKYNDVRYTVNRYGVKADFKKVFLQTEAVVGETTASRVTGAVTAHTNALDVNYVIGWYFDDNYTFYFNHSEGKNLTAGTSGHEHAYGVAYDIHPWAVAVEYHNGNTEGGWRSYTSTIKEWDLMVAAVTYQF